MGTRWEFTPYVRCRLCGPSFDIDTQFLGLMSKLAEDVSSSFGQLVKVLGHGYDLSKARNKLNKVLGEFKEFSIETKVRVGTKLASDAALLEYFFSLPPEEKIEFLRQQLVAIGGDLGASGPPGTM